MSAMGRPYGSRLLVTVCTALALLLAGLAIVQFGWATRVAAADVQREKEHLNTAASLFATEFNRLAEESAAFLQDEAWASLQSHERVAAVPKLIAEIYYLDAPAKGARRTERLGADGRFAAVSLPDWAASLRCASLTIEAPLALIESFGASADSCFVALLDLSYLHTSLFPQLIQQSFGATAAADYDFAVVSLNQPGLTLFGTRAGADLRQPFFSIQPVDLAFTSSSTRPPAERPSLVGPGVLELDVARKGLPLAAAFERKRRLDLLASLAVEALLLGAIVFLVIAARRMQRLADHKMQFVAGVSHELRTPVSAIAMLSRNQADGMVTSPERVKQYGELIHEQCLRLNEMVEQTLKYAGIHSNPRRSMREIDLGRLIEDALGGRREELARSGFQMEIAIGSDLPKIVGDAQWLRTAVENLLSNAQKYGDGGHWIRVSAIYDAPEREVRISVQDRGAGIDPADREEIFEPFCRGRAAADAQIPGSGLGLSLVRSAAEAHHGSVTLVSEPGRGSTFTLHLPV
jgi:two-component system, OmpR family, sensor histidine kinase SenX3